MKLFTLGLIISALSGIPATLAYCGNANISFEFASAAAIGGQLLAVAMYAAAALRK